MKRRKEMFEVSEYEKKEKERERERREKAQQCTPLIKSNHSSVGYLHLVFSCSNAAAHLVRVFSSQPPHNYRCIDLKGQTAFT